MRLGVSPYTHPFSEPLRLICFVSTLQLPFPSSLIKVCWEQTWLFLLLFALLCLANAQQNFVRCSGSSKARNVMLLRVVSGLGHAREMRQPHSAEVVSSSVQGQLKGSHRLEHVLEAALWLGLG